MLLFQIYGKVIGKTAFLLYSVSSRISIAKLSLKKAKHWSFEQDWKKGLKGEEW